MKARTQMMTVLTPPIWASVLAMADINAPRAVEHSAVACAERLLDKSWPARQGTASLMLILDGPDEESVLRQAESVAGILEGQNVLDILIADQKAKQEEILQIRSGIYEALREGTAELFDVCVPRSEIAGHVGFVHELEARYGVQLPTYGHAADGNVHSNYMSRRIEGGRLGAEVPGWKERHADVRRELFRPPQKGCREPRSRVEPHIDRCRSLRYGEL